jgi:hypothetical protein
VAFDSLVTSLGSLLEQSPVVFLRLCPPRPSHKCTAVIAAMLARLAGKAVAFPQSFVEAVASGVLTLFRD